MERAEIMDNIIFTNELLLPLTAAQSGMWFAQKLAIDTSFNVAEALEIHGPIDRDIFGEAFHLTVQEGDALRLSFIEDSDGPRQFIGESYNGTFSQLDFGDTGEGKAAAWHWMTEDLARPTDLLAGALCKAAIIRLADDHYVFYHKIPHILVDGYSGMLIARRLAEIYTALIEAREPDQNNALSSFDLIVQNEIAYRQSDRYCRDRQYWMDRLADPSPPVTLPRLQSERTQPSSANDRIRQRVRLDPETTAALRTHAKEAGVSLPQLLITFVMAYIYRMSGQNDLVIGLTLTGRTNRLIRHTLGMTANIVPLRLQVLPDMRLNDLIPKIAREVRQCLRHQQYRHEDLRRDLGLAPLQPLFSIGVNIEPFEYDLRLAGHPVTTHNLENGTTGDFGIFIFDRGEGKDLELNFEADPTLYSKDEIEQHQQRLIILIRHALAFPDSQLNRLSLISKQERHQQLVEWNDAATDDPPSHCIHSSFEDQTARTPDAIALVHEEQCLTYAELNARANRLAHHLIGLGIQPDDRVAICVERSPEMIVGLLAILKAGGAYVPLDPSYPKDRLGFMLKDSAPVAVLTHGAARSALDAALAPAGSGDTPPTPLTPSVGLPLIDLDDQHIWAGQSDGNPDAAAQGLSPANLAYIIYTSGSTGLPKGVMVEHRNVSRLFTSTDNWYRFNSEDVWTLFHSFAFDFSVWEIWGALLHGGRLIIVPQLVTRSPEEFYELLCRSGVTVLNQTPSAFRQLASLQTKSKSVHCLRYVIFGGEALELGDLVPWRMDERNSAVRLINMYGITETTVHVTYYPLEASAALESCRSPVGRAIPDLRVYILDEWGEPVPVGVTGELYIGGAGVARGYVNRPQLTAERFLKDPFVSAPDARMYRSGDIARFLACGTIDYLGRNDLQVKIRGFRIELGEIEARLREHPGIGEAVVIARENSEGDQLLVAYYTLAVDGGANDLGVGDTPVRISNLSGSAAVDASTLRAHMEAMLPSYMVPSAYVALEALTLTVNGKLDRKMLPAPDDKAKAYGGRGYDAPQGEIEMQLAKIFAAVLEVERVGRHDSFFELGGHSLLAVRLVARIRVVLTIDLPVRAVFEAPTVAGLAALCEGGEQAQPNLVWMAGAENAAPLFCLHAIGTHIDYYQPLAKALSGHFAVYALPHAADWWLEKGDVLQALSTRYADTIQEHQPRGPYRLLGWSAGGRIALAVAAELERRGEAMHYIGLLDMPLPGADDPDDIDIAVLLPLVLKTLLGLLRADNASAAIDKEIPAHLLERLIYPSYSDNDTLLEELLPYLQIYDPGMTMENLGLLHEEGLTMQRQYQRVVESNTLPVKAPLHLCWAQESPNRDHATSFDWSLLTFNETGNTQDIVDADHHAMVAEPHVFQLSSAILKVANALSSASVA